MAVSAEPAPARARSAMNAAIASTKSSFPNSDGWNLMKPRSIDLGFIKFQPSEFGKLLFVLAIAAFIAERARAGAGSALTAMLFVSGTPWRQLAVLGSLAALLISVVLWIGPAMGVNFLHGYQK